MLLAAVLWAVQCGPALAAQIILTAVADATLIDDAGQPLANGGGLLFVGKTRDHGLRRALLRFDLSAIPAGATVQSATLNLRMDRTRSDFYQVNVHRVLASWSEGAFAPFGGGGAPAMAGDTTWLHRFFGATQSWATPGGDFVATPSASTAPGFEGFDYAWSGSQLAADVQQWLDTPTANHGWIVVSDTVNVSARAFVSREGATPGLRPRLVVNYSEPVPPADGDVPLPAWALAMLAIAFWGAIRRRSR